MHKVGLHENLVTPPTRKTTLPAPLDWNTAPMSVLLPSTAYVTDPPAAAPIMSARLTASATRPTRSDACVADFDALYLRPVTFLESAVGVDRAYGVCPWCLTNLPDEVTKQKSIQVKIELPDDVIDDTVNMSLDMDGLDDQDAAQETIDMINAQYGKLVAAKFTLREIIYMRKTMEDIVRSTNKLPSRGADPRVLAELRKRDSPMMQDFASFLASTDVYVPGPNGMSY